MGTLAVGMMMVIITGGIDLSIGATLALSGMTAALYVRGNPQASAAVAILIGIGVGLLAGLINGLLVGYGEVLPLIATLGMMNVYRGLTYIIANGAWVSAHQMERRLHRSGLRPLSGYQQLVWVAILAFAAGAFFSATPCGGRMIYAVGCNRSSRVTGVNVSAIRTLVYVILGAIRPVGRLWVSNTLRPRGYRIGYDMNVIAACVWAGLHQRRFRRIFGVFWHNPAGYPQKRTASAEISPFWQVPFMADHSVCDHHDYAVQGMVDRTILQRRHI
jgi:rhamnose transport system permease protein